MTQPDKLTLGVIDKLISMSLTPGIGTTLILQQLADTMRENERLRSCLKAFYFDTMYKDNPGLHDLACDLLAPHDEEFAEVKRTKT